jgi:hypothetical protein
MLPLQTVRASCYVLNTLLTLPFSSGQQQYRFRGQGAPAWMSFRDKADRRHFMYVDLAHLVPPPDVFLSF